MATDIVLDENDDITIVNGDFAIGESLTQEVGLILKANQGEWKSDPLIGANLIQLINSNVDDSKLKTRVKLQLQRDGKDYNEIKDLINLKRVTQ
ncbi:oxidase [Winogradskyella phage Peternella_1]|uniref:Oxidase n=1 Tax=Winogradskyella phage Peternella_1 TaxID=2745699 RepID=A0A8E5EC55_9CAUD|nr:oxidase [Winogradskyella phage Peternella_1]QQV91587.1 oxidase [Winogradskyella phage Peternella_1]